MHDAIKRWNLAISFSVSLWTGFLFIKEFILSLSEELLLLILWVVSLWFFFIVVVAFCKSQIFDSRRQFRFESGILVGPGIFHSKLPVNGVVVRLNSWFWLNMLLGLLPCAPTHWQCFENFDFRIQAHVYFTLSHLSSTGMWKFWSCNRKASHQKLKKL